MTLKDCLNQYNISLQVGFDYTEEDTEDPKSFLLDAARKKNAPFLTDHFLPTEINPYLVDLEKLEAFLDAFPRLNSSTLESLRDTEIDLDRETMYLQSVAPLRAQSISKELHLQIEKDDWGGFDFIGIQSDFEEEQARAFFEKWLPQVDTFKQKRAELENRRSRLSSSEDLEKIREVRGEIAETGSSLAALAICMKINAGAMLGNKVKQHGTSPNADFFSQQLQYAKALYLEFSQDDIGSGMPAPGGNH